MNTTLETPVLNLKEIVLKLSTPVEGYCVRDVDSLTLEDVAEMEEMSEEANDILSEVKEFKILVEDIEGDEGDFWTAPTGSRVNFIGVYLMITEKWYEMIISNESEEAVTEKA